MSERDKSRLVCLYFAYLSKRAPASISTSVGKVRTLQFCDVVNYFVISDLQDRYQKCRLSFYLKLL